MGPGTPDKEMRGKRLKIAIIGSRGIPARWGGWEAFSEEVATRLSARGHHVTVYCRAGYSSEGRPREYRGVELIYMPYLPGKLLETPSHEMLCALHSLFRQFDIYYVLGARTSWCHVIHRLMGKRLVVNTDGLDWERRKWGFLTRNYLRFCYWVAVRLATCVASDSKVICEYLARRYRVIAEYLTCGAKVITSAPVEVLREYGLVQRSYFLLVCRIEPENNVDLIVQAFEGLSTDKRLVIVGGVNYASPYLRRLHAAKDPRVLFTGPVYKEGHVDALCRYCHAYIDGHEVGGTSPGLLRAMGCGCCVLVLNRPFNAEVVDGAGLTWEKSAEDLRKKMQYTLGHPAMVRDFGQRAAARVATDYQWDASTEAHEQCFFRLVYGTRTNPSSAEEAVQ